MATDKLRAAFPSVSRESWERLEIYEDLLRQWQARINLIAPSTVDTIWERHIADSLQLVNYLSESETVIADLGSGAGLPGLVLAAIPHGHSGLPSVHLYEANGKKCAFLHEAIRQMGVKAVVHPVRLEAVAGQASLPKVHVVTARALAALPELLTYALPFLQNGARGLFLKGQDVDSELTAADKYWRIRFKKHPSLIDSQDGSRGHVLEVTEVQKR